MQTARQKFSELVERALAEGPQVVTRRGREVVVVVAIDEYRRLRGGEPDFKRFLREGPDFEALDLERSTEPARTVDLGATCGHEHRLRAAQARARPACSSAAPA